MQRRLSSEQRITLLGGIFIAVILISTIASTKITQFGPFIFDAGTILFPLSYVIAGIITEIYGLKRVEFLIFVGLIVQIIASLTFWIVGQLPPQADWHNQEAYLTILGVVPRIAIASIIAYAIGELFHVRFLSFLKKRAKRVSLSARTGLALIVAQAIDTAIFSTLAFAGTMSFDSLLALIGTVYLIKLIVIVVCTPLSALLVRSVESSRSN